MNRLSLFFAPRMETVLNQLEAEGFIDSEAHTDSERALKSVVPDSPWYIQVMIALGAWMAAGCFLLAAAFILNKVFEDSNIYIDHWAALAGIILCSGATFYGWQAYNNRGLFLGQITLAVCITGQLLLIAVLGRKYYEMQWLIGVIILELVILLVYPGQLQRFASALIIIASLTGIVLDENIYWGLSALAVLVAAGMVAVWVRHPFIDDHPIVRDLLRALAYALPIGLMGLLLLPMTNREINYHMPEFDQPLAVTGGLLLLLLYLEARILNGYGFPLRSGLAYVFFGGTILIAIPSLWTPGIIGALMVVVIGFWRSNPVIVGLATIFLALFIGSFYYILDTSASVKGGLMVATGVVLLVLWLVTAVYPVRKKKVKA